MGVCSMWYAHFGLDVSFFFCTDVVIGAQAFHPTLPMIATCGVSSQLDHPTLHFEHSLCRLIMQSKYGMFLASASVALRVRSAESTHHCFLRQESTEGRS